jgi:chromosome segregation ATPase
MFELFNESLFLVLILMLVLTGIATRFWRNPLPSSLRVKLSESEAHVAKLQKLSEGLGRTIQNLETKMQKQLDAVESKVASLSSDVGAAIRETHDIEKHVGSLEAKTDVASTKVEAIKHQVDAEVGELKRIDDQIKDNMGKGKTNALHIQYLEDEVHGLERELSIPPIRVRRDRHVD